MSGRVVAGEDSEEDTPQLPAFGYGYGAAPQGAFVAGEDDEEDTPNDAPAYGYYAAHTHSYGNISQQTEKSPAIDDEEPLNSTNAEDEAPDLHPENEISKTNDVFQPPLSTPSSTSVQAKAPQLGIAKQLIKQERQAIDAAIRASATQLNAQDASLVNSNPSMARSIAIAQDINAQTKNIIREVQGLAVVMNRVGNNRQRGWLGVVKMPPTESPSTSQSTTVQ